MKTILDIKANQQRYSQFWFIYKYHFSNVHVLQNVLNTPFYIQVYVSWHILLCMLYFHPVFYIMGLYVWERCIIILFAHGHDLVSCQFWATPPPPPPFTAKHKTWGVEWYPAAFPSWTMRGSLDWFRFLPWLSFSWILGSLDFISFDSAQSIMCAEGRINNVLKVVFCFRHATPSHYRHYADFAHLHWTHTVKDSGIVSKRLLGIFCRECV